MIANQLRGWVRNRPGLMDRLKPVARAFGYISPIQREVQKHLQPARNYRCIQVGAHDGITHDPFREYMIQPGWEAVVVEPNPVVFAKLVRNYRAYPQVHPRNAAVGYSSPELTLWTFDEQYLQTRPDAAVLSTLVSFSPENMKQFLAPGDAALQHLRSLTVPCLTVEALLAERGWPRADALFVDVEGYENEILLKLDYPRLDARIIVFEHHLLADQGAAIQARLAEFGFKCSRTESDTVAVRAA